ncbi:sortase-associated OmpA-like protein PdsO [Shewanella litorisediminis]|uniref:Sortase-associated OmpA-like protein PdsO n=1 Tax=Shewanella litorisediminis TaxID=1173586 RepID=A0ABX7FZ38_9GAMM|nr:sortase-associated OmpA-like protein PdsO [Shewanella litorisediminis]MCL2918738.1 sortase-associated OmpA-like protein PdsO [Shewanella litorisediminis]QRH00291.1 sortase-associated OmpA-like protein PdsO [Shewanella litorisediminis]
MKTQLLASVISLALIAPAANAAERDHNEELVGLGSGALIGAAVGGPVGAIIGAFAGGIIGKSVGDDEEIKDHKLALATQDAEIERLAQKSANYDALASDYAITRAQLNTLQTAREAKLTELTLGLNVQFKTGSSEIEPHFQNQLQAVARVMEAQPDLVIDLKGFADRRGASDYNQALSEQRLANVKAYLVSAGVASDRLQGKAYGATAPLSADAGFESNFFDRRVTLELVPADTSMAATH